MAGMKFPILAPVGIAHLAAQGEVGIECQHLGFARGAIKEEEAILQRAIVIARIDFPAAVELMLLIGGADAQVIIKGLNEQFTRLAIIEEEAIASGLAERADMHLKGIMPAIKIDFLPHGEVGIIIHQRQGSRAMVMFPIA